MTHLASLFAIPLVSSLCILILYRGFKPFTKSLASLLSCIPLFLLFLFHNEWEKSSIDFLWFPALSLHFHLQVDSLSLLFLYLTALIIPITLFAAKTEKLENPHLFFALVLLLQALLIGFFTARDLALFTIFYEAMLLPLYFIITAWGGFDRQNTAFKFLLYMITGSALMVLAVLALFFTSATFNLDLLGQAAGTSPYASWIFAVFLLAFSVKTPLFPFHGWLPETYVSAPVSGTILLSALLSKAGIYGIIRIIFGFFPSQVQFWSYTLLILAIIGVLYGAFAAWTQKDFKRLIAYSSFSHVNFILIGLFIWNQTAHSGAILQAINHAITITALFLVIGWLEERLSSTAIGRESGLGKYMPILCWLTLFFALASIALPGLNNFVGEFMIFYGLFQQDPWMTAVLALVVIFSAIYMLSWIQKTYFELVSDFHPNWIDIGKREMIIALPLIALTIGIGIYPAPVIKQIEPYVAKQFAVVKPEEAK